jgi:glycosyltransferase involved in cell wall biosynthesis
MRGALPPAGRATVRLNVLCDIRLEQHAREFSAGSRPTALPYGMERLTEHGITPLDAPRLRHHKVVEVIEHRSGLRLQTLRALSLAARTDATLAMWEHWAELPSLLSRFPGPYRSKPLYSFVCWAAEDLGRGEPRLVERARRIIKASDLIFFLSRNQEEIFLAHGARPEQLVPVTFGVSTDFFTGDVDAPRDIDLLAVGIDAGRDYDTLVRAVEGTDLSVGLLTSEARASALALPPTVRPLGVAPPDEYRDLLQRSKVVVVPTHDLAYPTGQTVALDAAAAGCAVIATGTDAMREYFSDGVTALMPAARDATGLRAAMVGLLADPEARIELARRAQLHVRHHHSANVMWDQVAGALHSHLARREA